MRDDASPQRSRTLHRRTYRHLHIATDSLLVSLSWCGAYGIRQLFSAQLYRLASFSTYLKVLPLVVVTWLLSCWFFGIYKRVKAKTGIERTQDLLKSALLGWLLTSTIAFYFKEYHLGRTVIFLSGFLNLLLLSISWYIFHRLEQRASQLHPGDANALILGANTNGIRLLQKLAEHPEIRYNVVGFVDPETDTETLEQRPVWSDLKQLRSIVETHQIDEVFVALPDLNHRHIFPLVLECEALDVGFWLLTNDFEALTRNRNDLPHIEGVPLNYLGLQQPNPFYPVLKRLFDLSASLLLLVISAPFWLWWALRIKLDNPGPVFFAQTRVGQDGTTFKMYKFRTMRTDTNPYEEAPRTQEDNRVTAYGKWLRRTSIDEVPQLLNVLKGDMSLVGPRPEMPFIVETYDEWQRCRLRVKPGITGLWQILGRKDLPMQENLQYDFYYIRNRSLLLDLSILLRTLLVVFSGKGAY